MVDAYKGANEIISTEDMKAQIEILNEENAKWCPLKFTLVTLVRHVYGVL